MSDDFISLLVFWVLLNVFFLVRNEVVYRCNMKAINRGVAYDEKYFDRFSYDAKLFQISKWSAKQFYPKYKDRF